jgi:hypothetical protein
MSSRMQVPTGAPSAPSHLVSMKPAKVVRKEKVAPTSVLREINTSKFTRL